MVSPSAAHGMVRAGAVRAGCVLARIALRVVVARSSRTIDAAICIHRRIGDESLAEVNHRSRDRVTADGAGERIEAVAAELRPPHRRLPDVAGCSQAPGSNGATAVEGRKSMVAVVSRRTFSPGGGAP